MDRYRTLEGLLIGRKPLPGGDVILSFVTLEGAMQAVARKAMRPTGRSGRLSLFHHLRFQIYQKPGNDLPTLTQAELVGRLEGLEAPPRFAYASYLGELAFRLASPEVASRVWPILISGLRGIAKHQHPKIVLVWAGWRVLRAAGLQPNMTGQGESLEDGHLTEEDRGVFLGSEGVQALRAVLFLPGSEAVEALEALVAPRSGEALVSPRAISEANPLDRLLRALKVHADNTVGALNSAAML